MNKKRKLAASLTAGGMAAALLLTGTFAWRSISQKAKNEIMAETNPGGRLHDDFNGKNKDIYVENFTDEVEGAPIFARVRLREYMETGVGAGNLKDPDRDVQVIGNQTAQFDNPSTWAIHQFGDNVSSTDHLVFHDYITWDEDGGSTVYMPTFNKNKDSLLTDINGTLEGPDGLRPGVQGDKYDKYQDYKTYNVGDTLQGNAIYDADEDDDDEVGQYLTPDTVSGGYQVVVPPEVVEDAPEAGTDYILTKETHEAKNTQDCTVISMEEWKAKDPWDQVGNYWVYDTDGWAYWAAPIMPDTATGLLLDGVSVTQTPDEEWYYAIDVEAQFSTAYDWGTKDKNDGFFGNGGMQEDGESVLDMAAKSLNNKITISLNNTVEDIATVDSFVAQPGDKARFSVKANINGVEKQLSMTELGNVKWTISGNNVGASSIQSPYKYSVTSNETIYNCDDDSALLQLDETVSAETVLSIKAEYRGMTDSIELQVEELGYDDLGRVIPGSLTTVTIDGIEWYVLVKNQDKVLLWSENGVGYSEWADTSYGNWESSVVRNYLRTDFWNSLTTLKQTGVVELTALKSWDGRGYDISNWKSTTDAVFLLTEADLFGWASDYDDVLLSYNRRDVRAEDYTYCVSGVGQVIAPDVEARKYTHDANKSSPLRSNGGLKSGLDLSTGFSPNGVISAAHTINGIIRSVRPAMWVNMDVAVTP